MPAPRLIEILLKQREAQLKDGAPTAEQRIDRLNRCIALLVDRRRDIEAALTEDFGARSPTVTAFADVASSIGPLKHARDHVRGWMKTERRRTTPRILGFLGARAEIRHQPKGVVGVISPWNFPVNLTFAPLAGILAAGNRAMIKPSEIRPPPPRPCMKPRCSAAPSTRRRDRGGDRRAGSGAGLLRVPGLRSPDLHRRHLHRPPCHAGGG